MVIENMSSYTVPLKCIVDTNWIYYSLSYNNKSSTLIEYLIKKLAWCLVGGYNYKYASRCCFETFSIHVITKRSIYVVEQIYDLLIVQPLPKCRHHHSCLNNSWWYFYSASVYLAWNKYGQINTENPDDLPTRQTTTSTNMTKSSLDEVERKIEHIKSMTNYKITINDKWQSTTWHGWIEIILLD